MELEKRSEFIEFTEFVESNETDGVDSPPEAENDNKQIENDSSDLRPEYCHYRDEGCELAESCLNCPFANCIYDEPGGKRRWMKRLRAREIARLHIDEGKKVKELSEMFGISERTVQRTLKSIAGGSNVILNERSD